MRRRAFLQSVGVSAAGLSVAGCLGRGGEQGTLATYVSDRPGDIGDFESCVVTITELRVLPTDRTTATEEHEGSELLFSVDGTAVDLVELAGDASALAHEQDLPADDYAYLKLTVDSVEASLGDGRTAMVETPGNADLKFNQSFEVRRDETTRFTADFTPVQRGNRNVYVLRPVASETTVRYE